MFMYPSDQLPVTDLDKLFPSQAGDASQVKAEHALQSHMIAGFEEALDMGMPRMEALGSILSWVATEMARLGKSSADADSAPSWER
jgi:hypothetical protein